MFKRIAHRSHISAPAPVGRVAGTATGAVLAAIAGLHVAWGAGSTWPMRTPHEFATNIAGSNHLPNAGVTHTVAGLLFGAAGLLAVRSNLDSGWAQQVTRRVPAGVVDAGVATVSGLLAFRSVAGFALSGLGVSNEPFRSNDLAVFSPLTAALAVGTWLARR